MAKGTRKNGAAVSTSVEIDGVKYRGAKGGFLQLWKPQDNMDDPNYPKKIAGTFANAREQESQEGKRKWTSLWFDVIGKDGAGWAVACNEGLQKQVEAEECGDGMGVAVVFDGKGKKKKGLNAPNLFRLFVEE